MDQIGVRLPDYDTIEQFVSGMIEGLLNKDWRV